MKRGTEASDPDAARKGVDMNARICRTLALAALGLAGAAATSTAQAGVSWHIGINLPGPQVYYPPPPVVYHPAPVYYPPAVVYQRAPRVVYRAAPIYYRQAPVVVHQHGPRGHWHDGRWHDRKGRGHGDHDGDDRRNRHHQDRHRH